LPDATADEIRAAYHREASRVHPDRHVGNPLADLAAARLAELNAAYEILGDPKRRAAYDASTRGQAGAGPWPAGRPRLMRPGAVLVRILLAVFAVVLVVRAVAALWGPLRGMLSALRPSLAGLWSTLPGRALVLVAGAGLGVLFAIWLRRRARSRRRT